MSSVLEVTLGRFSRFSVKGEVLLPLVELPGNPVSCIWHCNILLWQYMVTTGLEHPLESQFPFEATPGPGGPGTGYVGSFSCRSSRLWV